MQIFVFVSNAATQKDGATKVNQIFMKMFFDADWWRCPPLSGALNCVREVWRSFTWKISQLILCDVLLAICANELCLMRLYRLFDFWMAQTREEKPSNQQVVLCENLVTQTILERKQWGLQINIYLQFCIWRRSDESKLRNMLFARSLVSWRWTLRKKSSIYLV